MTKENAKDFLPLVQALAEGKTIQKLRDHYFWRDYDERIDGAIENIPIENLRIKPEDEYVPFESVDELIECWADKRKIPLFGVDGKAVWNPIDMPLIWVKGKGTQAKYLITEYWSASVCIGDDLRDLKELYDCYTFLDGTPIGKIKE